MELASQVGSVLRAASATGSHIAPSNSQTAQAPGLSPSVAQIDARCVWTLAGCIRSVEWTDSPADGHVNGIVTPPAALPSGPPSTNTICRDALQSGTALLRLGQSFVAGYCPNVRAWPPSSFTQPRLVFAVSTGVHLGFTSPVPGFQVITPAVFRGAPPPLNSTQDAWKRSAKARPDHPEAALSRAKPLVLTPLLSQFPQ